MKINKLIYKNHELSVNIKQRLKHSPATEIKTEKIEFDIEDTDKNTFEGDGDYIDTKVDLFDDLNNNWTLLIDFVDTGKIEWYNSLFILHNFYEGYNNELYGFNIQKTGEAQGGRLAFQVNDRFYPTKALTNGTHTRLVIRFTAPSTLEMFFNDPDLDDALGCNSYYNFGQVNFHDVNNCTLHLACWYNENEGGVGRFWRGIINEFVVWDKESLSNEEVLFILNNSKEPENE